MSGLRFAWHIHPVRRNRGTATERFYALFWQVQQMQSVSGQLEKCFWMLRMLDYVTNKTRMSLWPSAALGI